MAKFKGNLQFKKAYREAKSGNQEALNQLQEWRKGNLLSRDQNWQAEILIDPANDDDEANPYSSAYARAHKEH
ncbi:hypothetical protein [Helicobacter suis]|uniref:hypothetical protein n=1 Tax=Helicobacter suis TaxID=104628 RepID=UPI000CF0E750|nr:hypothetical protein [Helicobacter suis]